MSFLSVLLRARDKLFAIVHAATIAQLIKSVSIAPQCVANKTRRLSDVNVNSDERKIGTLLIAVRQYKCQRNHFCFLSLPLEVAIFSDSESNSDSDSEDDPGDKY